MSRLVGFRVVCETLIWERGETLVLPVVGGTPDDPLLYWEDSYALDYPVALFKSEFMEEALLLGTPLEVLYGA